MRALETPPMAEQTAAVAVGEDAPHESAHLHVSGEAVYVDDIPEWQGALHAALGLSAEAHARVAELDLAAVRAAPGVAAVMTAADIPGVNQCGPSMPDEPILAEDTVFYVGQPLFVVLADSQMAARKAVQLATVRYAPLDAVLDARTAHERGQYVLPPIALERGAADTAIEAAPLRLQGEFAVGGQEHFYLEGQISMAAPKEDGCLHVWCSTQHPSEMQHLVAQCTGRTANQVTVETRRMGGGFGGKESQSAAFACIAAIAAIALDRPVKLRLDRDDDMLITGKRHGFDYDYDVGFDESGLIRGLRVAMLSDAGFSADLSGPVMARAVFHVDNAYFLENVSIAAYPARTHRQSSTAFRGFGGPQGALITEYVIEAIARRLGMDPLAVRQRNFYASAPRDVTPYRQTVADNIIAPLVAELVADADYAQRREAIQAFNRTSPVLKRGIAVTPVKFGISFTLKHLNQAGALVHVYTDGTVSVNHGGTEMGQGLHTKVAQIVARELGVSQRRLRVTATVTDKVPNTSATAASSGTDLNGMAAQRAAGVVRRRLAEFVAHEAGVAVDAVRFADDHVQIGERREAFVQVIKRAYEARVQLWSDGFYATPDLDWDAKTLTGRPFYYYAYGAAVSEVLLDTLTGEWRLQRVNILHDAGNSVNPSLDMGQVEGGFVQGMGWLTTEQLCWNDSGRLTTHAPSTYKIPTARDVPRDMTVRLFNNPNAEPTVLRSKAVGEPPLLLGFSVFFAIQDAIANAVDADYGKPRPTPKLRAPATPEAILAALDDLGVTPGAAG